MNMLSAPSNQVLDALLSFQLTVAWAGEGLAEPKRLDWWRTDLVDEGGGGDLLHRLLPKTYQWAALAAVRQAAIQVERQMRLEISNSDAVRTLFFWGFELDEALSDRLAHHKRMGSAVNEVMALPMDFKASFSMAGFEAAVRMPDQRVEFKVLPSGRELSETLPAALELRAQKLMVALLPLAESYPMPFYRVPG
jgi:hypothetical protein